LKKDSRFWNVADQMKDLGPGPERNKIVDEFWKGAYQDFYVSEREMIRVRGRVLSDYIGLLDEDRLECERSLRPSHVVERGGDSLQEYLRDAPIPPIVAYDAHQKDDRSNSDSHSASAPGKDRHNVDTIQGGF
jgi:hypothetical protein